MHSMNRPIIFSLSAEIIIILLLCRHCHHWHGTGGWSGSNQKVSKVRWFQRLPTSSSPFRCRTWDLSMLQHGILSVIWAKKNQLPFWRRQRLSSYSSASLWRSNVSTLCFCTTHSALIARTNSHSSYVFNLVFNAREPLLPGVEKNYLKK